MQQYALIVPTDASNQTKKRPCAFIVRLVTTQIKHNKLIAKLVMLAENLLLLKQPIAMHAKNVQLAGIQMHQPLLNAQSVKRATNKVDQRPFPVSNVVMVRFQKTKVLLAVMIVQLVG